MDFEIVGTEFIELKNLLKAAGLCENGGMAKAVIADGQVRVDGKVETRKACKIKPGQKVTYAGKTINVS